RNRAAMLACLGDVSEAIEVSRAADEPAPDEASRGLVRMTLVQLLIFDGRLGEAESVAAKGREWTLRQPTPLYVGQWSHALGCVDLASGRLGSAVSHLVEAAEQIRHEGIFVLRQWCLAGLALAAGASGDAPLGRSALDEVAGLPFPLAPYHQVELVIGRAWTEAAEGRIQEARRTASTAPRLASDFTLPV